MDPPQDKQTGKVALRTPKRRIDPALARRNRRTAGILVLLVLASLAAFLANFGVFK